MDDVTSLDDISFEAPTGAQRGSSNSVNLSVATTDSSSSSGCELSKTKVSMCIVHTLITHGWVLYTFRDAFWVECNWCTADVKDNKVDLVNLICMRCFQILHCM